MLENAIVIYKLQLDYAQKLLADVPDERLCDQPVPGVVMNHAAFNLGHLAWVGDMAVALLGGKPATTPEWKELFSMGAKPLADRSKYPSKAELLAALEDSHRRLTEAAAKASAETLAQPAPERMRARFPTLGAAVTGMMTAHEASHLGQISAWRRALGFPSVF
jgi:hypothetical protein